MRGKCPGKKGSKGWYGYGFTKELPDESDIAQWEKWGANIGLLGDNYPGLDIDSGSKTLVKLVLEIADRVMGGGPVRTGRPPRVLRTYKARAPFARMALIATHNGESHMIEVLGQGRQYLVYGKHPAGMDYEWDIPLWDLKPGQLNEINPKLVTLFFNEIKRVLEPKGIECEVVGSGETKEQKSPEQTDLLAPSVIDLADCVRKIPNTSELWPDRDDYIRMGHAIKAAAGQENDLEGFNVFLEWCDRWDGNDKNPEGNLIEVVERDWRKMHGPYRVGWSWLVEQAGQCSTDYQAPVDEFEADLEMIDAPDADVARAVVDASAHVVDAPSSSVDVTLERSDYWYRDQVRAEVEGKILYSPERKLWHVWNGYQWRIDNLLAARAVVEDALLHMSQHAVKAAESAPNEKQKKAAETAAMKMQSAKLARTVEDLLRSRLSCEVASFDQDVWVLNTPTGLVDLRTGDLHPSDPNARCAYATACGPADGRPERFLRYLDETTQGDKALQRFLIKLMGYCLTGVTDEQTLSFIWGTTNTGKSLFIKTMKLLFGDYADVAAPETFATTRGDRHPADMAKLVGRRLVISSETEAGRAWDSRRVKEVTAGDPMTARFMKENFFTFTPTFKVVMVGNHEPAIKDLDDAMAARVHIIPFTHQVAPSDQISRYEEELVEEEGPQILNMLIKGCLSWQETKPLDPPEVVRLRTKQYHYEEDSIQQWLDERCVISEELETSGQLLYEDWSQWCRQGGEHPGTRRSFKQLLVAKKLPIKTKLVTSRRLAGYAGIALVDLNEEFE
jgi:putative DNA primase/helicase